MKAKELIEELQKCAQDADVGVLTFREGYPIYLVVSHVKDESYDCVVLSL